MIERLVYKLTLRYLRRFDVEDAAQLKVLLREFNAKTMRWKPLHAVDLHELLAKTIANRSGQVAENVTRNNATLKALQTRNALLSRLQEPRGDDFLRTQSALDAE